MRRLLARWLGSYLDVRVAALRKQTVRQRQAIARTRRGSQTLAALVQRYQVIAADAIAEQDAVREQAERLAVLLEEHGLSAEVPV